MRNEGQFSPRQIPVNPNARISFFHAQNFPATLGLFSRKFCSLYFFSLFFLLSFFSIFSIFSPSAFAFHLEKAYFTPDNNKPHEQLYYHAYYNNHPGKVSQDAVIFIQGRNEFIEMYEDVASSFMDSYKNDVYLFDLRGQGKSSGLRCHIDHFDEYISDLDAFIKDIKKRFGYKNIHISSHSTGGLVSSLYLSKYPDALGPHGTLVLGSPFFALNKGGVTNWAAWGISKILSKTPWTTTFPVKKKVCDPFEKNDLTNDRELYEQFKDHDLKCGPPTWGWFNAAFNAINELKQNKSKIKVPILLLTAGDDTVVMSEVSKKFCEELNIQNPGQCHHQDFPGMRHLLYHETERNNVLKRIGQFRVDLMKQFQNSQSK